MVKVQLKGRCKHMVSSAPRMPYIKIVGDLAAVSMKTWHSRIFLKSLSEAAR